jgi:hypothetical protein
MLDTVALLEDMPEHDLWRGEVGTVVEALASGVVEVEFSDNSGRTYALVPLPVQSLIVLRERHAGSGWPDKRHSEDCEAGTQDDRAIVQKIRAIEEYGRLYVDRLLREALDSRGILLTDPRKALLFYLSKVFYRGRRDELSKRFLSRTVQALQEGGLNEYERDREAQALDSRLQSYGVNNRHDRQMVTGSLAFLYGRLRDYDGNIVRYAIGEIEAGRIRDVYTELTAIHGIGNKQAAFYLRDTCLVYGLEPRVKREDLLYVFPLDTWVKQVAINMGITSRPARGERNSEGAQERVKTHTIRACLDAGVSPLLFNAGAWYIGARAFDLTLDRL